MKTIEEIINSDTFTDEELIHVAYNLDEDDRAIDFVKEALDHYEPFEEWSDDQSECWSGYIIGGEKYYTMHYYDQNNFRSANCISYLELNNYKCYFGK